MRNQLVLPMAFYVFYIWCLAVFMFRTRVKAIKSGEVGPKFFKTYTGTPPSERTTLVGRHYDNQFQLPLVFFVVCTLHISIGKPDGITLGLAWLFVITRLIHSWVHLGSNILPQRVVAFTTGWIAVLLMWAQLVYIALLF